MWLLAKKEPVRLCTVFGDDVEAYRVYPSRERLGTAWKAGVLRCIDIEPVEDIEIYAMYHGDGIVSLATVHYYVRYPRPPLETVVGLGVAPGETVDAWLYDPVENSGVDATVEYVNGIAVARVTLPRNGLFYVIGEYSDGGAVVVDLFFRVRPLVAPPAPPPGAPAVPRPGYVILSVILTPPRRVVLL